MAAGARERAVPWAITAKPLALLALASPFALFLLLNNVESLNPMWRVPERHFYIVSATAFTAGAIGGAFLVSIKSLAETRSVFLGLGFVAMAIIFLTHGLATPGVYFPMNEDYLGVVSVSAGMSMVASSTLVTLSVLPWERLHGDALRWGRVAAVTGIAVVGTYLAVSLWRPEITARIPVNDTTQPIIGLAVICLLLFAASRYWRAWRLTAFPAQFSMVAALVLLAEAQVSMVWGHLFRADWWLYHVLMLGAFLTVVAGWGVEAVRARSVVLFARSLTLREVLDSLQEGGPEALVRLEAAMEARDSYTSNHMSRTAIIATGIAREMKCDPLTIAIVEGAARIHDIGKIAVPDAVLLKSGPLTAREYEQVKGHTARGEHIARESGSLAHLGGVIRAHHERFGGGGYPDGLAGDRIPLAARIVAVADTFDALTSTRAYRAAKTIPFAISELQRVSGPQLDPRCVAAFLRWYEREGRAVFEGVEPAAPRILRAA
jgi:HD-GYP domain-containing protein (c-di-GMP phosphodiesterase class II)